MCTEFIAVVFKPHLTSNTNETNRINSNGIELRWAERSWAEEPSWAELCRIFVKEVKSEKCHCDFISNCFSSLNSRFELRLKHRKESYSQCGRMGRSSPTTTATTEMTKYSNQSIVFFVLIASRDWCRRCRHVDIVENMYSHVSAYVYISCGGTMNEVKYFTLMADQKKLITKS